MLLPALNIKAINSVHTTSYLVPINSVSNGDIALGVFTTMSHIISHSLASTSDADFDIQNDVEW